MTELDRFSDDVYHKAQVTVRDRRVYPDPQSRVVWWVRSDRPGGPVYRVQLLPRGFMTCTCNNGQNTGGEPQCYHSAAVLLTLQNMRKRREERGE